MPTYAYACTACEHTFEVQQSFADSSLTVCPECDGRLRKVFASGGVVFKGSGFYRNDSRAGAVKAATKSSSSRPSETVGSSTSSTPAPTSTAASSTSSSTATDHGATASSRGDGRSSSSHGSSGSHGSTSSRGAATSRSAAAS